MDLRQLNEGQSISANEHAMDFQALPVGEYVAKFVGEEHQENGNLKLKLLVLEGEHKGVMTSDYLALASPNAHRMIVNRLAVIAHAARLRELTDTKNLQGKVVVIKIEERTAKDGKIVRDIAGNGYRRYETKEEVFTAPADDADELGGDMKEPW